MKEGRKKEASKAIQTTMYSQMTQYSISFQLVMRDEEGRKKDASIYKLYIHIAAILIAHSCA